MKSIPDKSVDLVICDLPYGETNCKWHTQIDLEEFWKEFKRIRKSKKTACIHFCSTKFGYNLIKSWEKGYKMDLVWKKRNKTGGLQSRYRPMRNHEMIYFFYEEAPKYNRDKYHKRINTKTHDLDTNVDGSECSVGKSSKFGEAGYIKCFEPPNPGSVVEDKTHHYEKGEVCYGTDIKDNHKHIGKPQFEPPNPSSVVEEKEKKPNLDTCYGKACGGGGWGAKEFKEKLKQKGLTGCYEPPNPSSVLEEEGIKDEFGWDKNVVKETGNKIGKVGANFEPPNPGSVIEGGNKSELAEDFGWEVHKLPKEERGKEGFEPRLPGSVIEEVGRFVVYGDDAKKKFVDETTYKDGERTFSNKAWKGNQQNWDKDVVIGPCWKPALPLSIVEENNDGSSGPQTIQVSVEANGEPIYNENGDSAHGYSKQASAFYGEGKMSASFDPPLPLSVVDEIKNEEKLARTHGHTEISMYKNEYIDFYNYDPPNPASVVESGKCFIGKRNHQTEKPLDVLEFLIKYWSDEDWTVLDPTMGSGSTAVAAGRLKRKFIGFELDETIFKKAQERVKNEIEPKAKPKKDKAKTKADSVKKPRKPRKKKSPKSKTI
jgi:DNA modification methylase